MLRFLSRRERSSKVLLMGLLVLLCIGLVGFFTGSIGSGWLGGGAGDDSTAARVASQKITIKELRDRLTQMGNQAAASQGGAGMDDPAIVYGMYGKEVLDGLIKQKLVE